MPRGIGLCRTMREALGFEHWARTGAIQRLNGAGRGLEEMNFRCCSPNQEHYISLSITAFQQLCIPSLLK
jgi:hypothetical protein